MEKISSFPKGKKIKLERKVNENGQEKVSQIEQMKPTQAGL